MVPTPTRRCSPCALPSLLFTLLLAAQAQAQSPASTGPDPLDPKAQVPSVSYESTFAQFRRIGDDKPMTWREANDAVARIGGWRVYAREAQQPDPAVAEKSAAPAQAHASAPASAPAAAAKPMPSGPSGHKH
jgi:hypothetical protein